MPYILILLMLFAAPAHADERLHTSEYWSVDYITFEDGTDSCRMSSGNDDIGHSISIWLDPDGVFEFQAASTEWDLPTRNDVTIYVVIDNENFVASPEDIDGEPGTPARTFRNSVFVDNLDDDFIQAVAYGNRLKLYNKDEELKLDYSLAGSQEAVAWLLTCGSEIRHNDDSDPFTGVTDEF